MIMNFDYKTSTELLNNISIHVREGHLGIAIDKIDLYLRMKPNPELYSKLEDVKSVYKYMQEYNVLKGVKDENLERLYKIRLSYLWQIYTDLRLEEMNTADNSLITSWGATIRITNNDWSWEAVRRRLEDFVGNVFLAQNEENDGGSNRLEIYREHQRYRDDLFKYILSLKSITEGECDDLTKLLTTPTVDSADQQLILAAFTINALRCFDFNKFLLFQNTFIDTEDENVRQRALVGLALTLGSGMENIFPMYEDFLNILLRYPGFIEQLHEMQIQLLYCHKAVEDSDEIQRDIMPTIAEGQTYRITEDGIKELEEDPMDDLLGKHELEKKMELMEEGIRRMMEMYNQGSDIYYGGFYHMKGFALFNEPSNWFVPYYKEHPGLEINKDNKEEIDIITKMMEHTPFCDCDRYSFVLSMKSVIRRLPVELRNMLVDAEKVTLGVEMPPQNDKTNIRRNYLQCMYRFFSQYKYKDSFVNPFAKYGEDDIDKRGALSFSVGYLPIANKLLTRHMVVILPTVINMLLRNVRNYDVIVRVLSSFNYMTDDFKYTLLCGRTLIKLQRFGYASDHSAASTILKRALQLKPDSLAAKKSLGMALLQEHKYDEALVIYCELADKEKDNPKWQTMILKSLLGIKDYIASRQLAAKLYYEDPDNNHILYMLGRSCLGCQDAEKANEYFERILKEEEYNGEGPLIIEVTRNNIIALWALHGDMERLISELVEYVITMANMQGDDYDIFGEMNNSDFLHLEDGDVELLTSYGIGREELNLVASMVYDKLREQL